MRPMNRRNCLEVLGGIGIGSTLFHRALAVQAERGIEITAELVRDAAWVADDELTDQQCQEVAKTITEQLSAVRDLREFPIDADTPLSVAFSPYFFASPQDAMGDLPKLDVKFNWSNHPLRSQENETNWESPDEETAFASIGRLGKMLRSKEISCVELTKIYLGRLHRFNPLLNCVVNLTESIAMQQAEKADAELAKGKDRGPLHGIPYGAKDIMAVPGFPTTWGVSEYAHTERKPAATVVERMETAGAVLLGKLSVGTMAWGDRWHGGLTRNPWNPKQGSSGSSAGSACAVAAGLCGFALGTETYGSIVSPTRRCAVTGLRPTFGRVSRAGCMALGWTLDKVGPITRHVEDAAAVFAKLLGADGRDPTVVHRSFHWPNNLELSKLRVGVVPDQLSEREQRCAELLEQEGAEIIEVTLPDSVPIQSLMHCLDCEATTMHDDLYRQTTEEAVLGNWGPVFRGGQWLSAVHYLRGLRARTQLIREMEELLSRVDVLLGSQDLAHTNLSGHPSLVVSLGTRDTSTGPRPETIKLTAKMFAEDSLLAVGQFLQLATPVTPLAPPLEQFLAEYNEGLNANEGRSDPESGDEDQ